MTKDPTVKSTPRENPFLSLLLNIVVPSFILLQFSEKHQLGPTRALVIAFSIPLAYGIYDYVRRREFSFFATLGMLSVLLTGGLGLMKASALWIALKEASFPLFFAGVFLLTARSRKPLIRMFLMAPELVDVPAIEHNLRKKNKSQEFDRLIVHCSFLMAASMLLCAVLSFGVAIYLLRSEPGTPDFNEELGRMTYLSFPVAGGPAFLVLLLAFWILIRGIKNLTGLETDDIFNPR